MKASVLAAMLNHHPDLDVALAIVVEGKDGQLSIAYASERMRIEHHFYAGSLEPRALVITAIRPLEGT